MKNISRSLVIAIVVAIGAPQLFGQCVMQLSEQGEIHIMSGQSRTLSWVPVQGAGSYLVEALRQGLGTPPPNVNDPFGAPYTESVNVELSASQTSLPVEHASLVTLPILYTVTAVNRRNPAFVPCKAFARYIVEPNEALAQLADRRFVPIAGKTRGANGSEFTTTLILSGREFTTTFGGVPIPQDPLNGRVVFRPLGQAASDSDPSIPYSLDQGKTLVFEDVMAELGAAGVGTLEIVPVGPAPLAEAIIQNIDADGKRYGIRTPAVLGRDYMTRRKGTLNAVISDPVKSRLSFGIRSLGTFDPDDSFGAFVSFFLLSHDGVAKGVQHRTVDVGKLQLFTAQELFGATTAGDRIVMTYENPAIAFTTETDNATNDPTVVLKEDSFNRRYSQGFDPFLIY